MAHEKKVRLQLLSMFGSKCAICGYNKCTGALHFHHIDPSKKSFGIGDNHLCLEKKVEEAKKCILLCANCHIEVEMKITELPENFENLDDSA